MKMMNVKIVLVGIMMVALVLCSGNEIQKNENAPKGSPMICPFGSFSIARFCVKDADCLKKEQPNVVCKCLGNKQCCCQK